LSGLQVIERAGTSRQKWLCCFTLTGIQRAALAFISIFVTVTIRGWEIIWIPSLKLVCRLT
jgi:hypothetical protein